jgi:hypothetical protein
VRNAAIAIWDIIGLAAQQIRLARSRRAYLKALANAPRDSALAVRARAIVGKANLALHSIPSLAMQVLRIFVRDAATAVCEALGGGVGTFFIPGFGTFAGELVGGLLLAPKLGLEPFADRVSLAEEVFFWEPRSDDNI